MARVRTAVLQAVKGEQGECSGAGEAWDRALEESGAKAEGVGNPKYPTGSVIAQWL